jgi:outer membrane protein assembly factor BamA
LKTLRYIILLTAILSCLKASAQRPGSAVFQRAKQKTMDTLVVDSVKQKDVIDIALKVINKNTSPDKRAKSGKVNISIIPYAGYSLSTGLIADISSDFSFYTAADHHQNLSVVANDLGYDSKIQKLFRTRSEIWAANNNYKFVTDLRFEIYPTDTYGLGTFAPLSTDDDISYRYLRVYETVLKKITDDYYVGGGYNLDCHYDITAGGNSNGSVSDFMKYGQADHSTSSGINLTLLYDSRQNPINPLKGTYANLIFRQNLNFLGSNTNWEQVAFDFRKYVRLSPQSNNVLAFWAIAAFTGGNAPYLDLPATGSDMYNNSGRGYAIGRYRGKNELYFETEYRFGITRNGLLGAVLFANGESFSGLNSGAFEGLAPAAGTGIRIKVNKHSNSNICVDYGVGVGGSHGLFVNLGEVF